MYFFAIYNVYKIVFNKYIKLQKKIFGRQSAKSNILGFSELSKKDKKKYAEPLQAMSEPQGFATNRVLLIWRLPTPKSTPSPQLPFGSTPLLDLNSTLSFIL